MKRRINVEAIARVEGEGALFLEIENDRVKEARLRIYEPPRFFEAFLRGRGYAEAPDITARICGICPVAYQMSAVHAMEDAFGARVKGPLRALRRLLYCGEWIESHALHVFMLHAPDFLGYEDAIRMAKDHPQVVERGLRLKKLGNEIVTLLGGREIHPINVRVGGFYKLPSKREFRTLLERLLPAREEAIEAVRWVARLPFPDFESDYEFVSLKAPDEYPFNEGRLVSNQGLDISVQEFDLYFTEEHVAHSNALHSSLNGRGPYFLGPLSRFHLNYENLSPLVKELAREVGLAGSCRNPFQSIIVRCLEILYAYDEAIRILESYEPPDRPAEEVAPRAGTGYACTEAPRGMLYHRYRIDEQGLIADAQIVPPTSQNQKVIEQDLREFASTRLHLKNDELQWQCEQAIRNYDPCISCATHFLRLEIKRNV